MPEIPKAYEPQAVEEKWYAVLAEAELFHGRPASRQAGLFHRHPPAQRDGHADMGHVLNNTIQDILARKARMQGNEVLWLPGHRPRRHRHADRRREGACASRA